MELTHSSIHHLMAIHHLINSRGYARAVDVAKYLQISRSSASVTLNKLLKKGFVLEDVNKFFSLTPQGDKQVIAVLEKRDILKNFLVQVLQISASKAENQSCVVEHLIQDEVSGKLLNLLDYYNSDQDVAAKFKEQWFEFIETRGKH